MDPVLLTAGIACVAAAIVGGGLKGFGIEVPLLKSRSRRYGLACFGVLLVVASALVPAIGAGKTADLRMKEASKNDEPQPAEVSSGQRTVTVEVGSKDITVVSKEEPKKLPVTVVLTDDDRPVGSITFQFFSQGTIFKIREIRDREGRAITNYWTSSGDKHVLQNWSELEVTFGDAKYHVGFEYTDGRITLDTSKIK